MKITVVGLGFVGLTVAAGFAEKGHTVIGVENNEEKYNSLKKGKIPFYEPGLPEVFGRNLKEGRLSVVQSTAEGVKDKDLEAILIAVGTPPKEDGSGKPELKYIINAAKEIAKSLDHYAVIVEKSTVPIRTADWMKQEMGNYIDSNLFDVASCPEFLRESTALYDFFNPDRIVIGTDSRKAAETLIELYSCLGAVPIIPMSIKEAEITKHVSNAMLYQRIADAQTLSQLADKENFNYEKVMQGVGLDKRIGPDFLKAGLVGGFCFPKDMEAFIAILRDAEVYAGQFEAISKVNEFQKESVTDKVWEMMDRKLDEKTVGILGLSFKANTSDMRLAPSIDIIEFLQDNGARIAAYDPKAMDEAKEIFPEGIDFCRNAYEVAHKSDLLLILTEWNEFKNLDLSLIKKDVTKIVDARNLYDPVRMHNLGFEYDSMGRPLSSYKKIE